MNRCWPWRYYYPSLFLPCEWNLFLPRYIYVVLSSPLMHPSLQITDNDHWTSLSISSIGRLWAVLYFGGNTFDSADFPKSQDSVRDELSSDLFWAWEALTLTVSIGDPWEKWGEVIAGPSFRHNDNLQYDRCRLHDLSCLFLHDCAFVKFLNIIGGLRWASSLIIPRKPAEFHRTKLRDDGRRESREEGNLVSKLSELWH